MVETKLKDAFYYRYILQKCAKLKKLVIVTGVYDGICFSDSNRITFINISPYLPENKYLTTPIARHLNLNRTDCINYLKSSNFELGQKYIITGKPYMYYNKNNELKGGIILSTDLTDFGFNPIMDFSEKMYKKIPYNLIVDFRKEFDGIYAWEKDQVYNVYELKEDKMKKILKDNEYFVNSYTYSENISNKDKPINNKKDDVTKNKKKTTKKVENKETVTIKEEKKSKQIKPNITTLNTGRNIDSSLASYSASISELNEDLSKKIFSEDIKIPPYFGNRKRIRTKKF